MTRTSTVLPPVGGRQGTRPTARRGVRLAACQAASRALGRPWWHREKSAFKIRILLGTDTPYASEDGKGNAMETIANIQALPIPPAQKEQLLGL